MRSQVCYVVNMGLHVRLAATIYATYVKGVVAVSNMDDKAALYGTDDDDNPFADLERIKREISTLLLKIFLTSAAEDIPQFAFNVLHYEMKRSETPCAMYAANDTSSASEEEGGNNHELLYLLKSAVMVRGLSCAPAARAFRDTMAVWS